jgi:hypothetical protein
MRNLKVDENIPTKAKRLLTPFNKNSIESKKNRNRIKGLNTRTKTVELRSMMDLIDVTNLNKRIIPQKC